MSMLTQVGGTAIVPPDETAHHLTREEQVHFTDHEKREMRREQARLNARSKK